MATNRCCLLLAATLLLLLNAAAADNAGVIMQLENRCPFTVWPGWISGEGGAVEQGGAKLDAYQNMSLLVPHGWGGRFWGRTGCNFGAAAAGVPACETGDCGGVLGCGAAGGVPPVTLAEFKLDGYGGNDFYDVSLVDGYNLPLRITPVASGCAEVGCHSDVNANCPRELQLLSGAGGGVVGCKSACEAFQTDAFCCRGAFGESHSCSPSQYSRIFKSHCPQAYSYAYDDLTSTFTCSAGGAGYSIQFCPSGGDGSSAATPRRMGHHHHGRPRGRGHHN